MMNNMTANENTNVNIVCKINSESETILCNREEKEEGEISDDEVDANNSNQALIIDGVQESRYSSPFASQLRNIDKLGTQKHSKHSSFNNDQDYQEMLDSFRKLQYELECLQGTTLQKNYSSRHKKHVKSKKGKICRKHNSAGAKENLYSDADENELDYLRQLALKSLPFKSQSATSIDKDITEDQNLDILNKNDKNLLKVNDEVKMGRIDAQLNSFLNNNEQFNKELVDKHIGISVQTDKLLSNIKNSKNRLSTTLIQSLSSSHTNDDIFNILKHTCMLSSDAATDASLINNNLVSPRAVLKSYEIKENIIDSCQKDGAPNNNVEKCIINCNKLDDTDDRIGNKTKEHFDADAFIDKMTNAGNGAQYLNVIKNGKQIPVETAVVKTKKNLGPNTQLKAKDNFKIEKMKEPLVNTTLQCNSQSNISTPQLPSFAFNIPPPNIKSLLSQVIVPPLMATVPYFNVQPIILPYYQQPIAPDTNYHTLPSNPVIQRPFYNTFTGFQRPKEPTPLMGVSIFNSNLISNKNNIYQNSSKIYNGNKKGNISLEKVNITNNCNKIVNINNSYNTNDLPTVPLPMPVNHILPTSIQSISLKNDIDVTKVNELSESSINNCTNIQEYINTNYSNSNIQKDNDHFTNISSLHATKTKNSVPFIETEILNLQANKYDSSVIDLSINDMIVIDDIDQSSDSDMDISSRDSLSPIVDNISIINHLNKPDILNIINNPILDKNLNNKASIPNVENTADSCVKKEVNSSKIFDKFKPLFNNNLTYGSSGEETPEEIEKNLREKLLKSLAEKHAFPKKNEDVKNSTIQSEQKCTILSEQNSKKIVSPLKVKNMTGHENSLPKNVQNSKNSLPLNKNLIDQNNDISKSNNYSPSSPIYRRKKNKSKMNNKILQTIPTLVKNELGKNNDDIKDFNSRNNSSFKDSKNNLIGQNNNCTKDLRNSSIIQYSKDHSRPSDHKICNKVQSKYFAANKIVFGTNINSTTSNINTNTNETTTISKNTDVLRHWIRKRNTNHILQFDIPNKFRKTNVQSEPIGNAYSIAEPCLNNSLLSSVDTMLKEVKENCRAKNMPNVSKCTEKNLPDKLINSSLKKKIDDDYIVIDDDIQIINIKLPSKKKSDNVDLRKLIKKKKSKNLRNISKNINDKTNRNFCKTKYLNSAEKVQNIHTDIIQNNLNNLGKKILGCQIINIVPLDDNENLDYMIPTNIQELTNTNNSNSNMLNDDDNENFDNLIHTEIHELNNTNISNSDIQYNNDNDYNILVPTATKPNNELLVIKNNTANCNDNILQLDEAHKICNVKFSNSEVNNILNKHVSDNILETTDPRQINFNKILDDSSIEINNRLQIKNTDFQVNKSRNQIFSNKTLFVIRNKFPVAALSNESEISTNNHIINLSVSKSCNSIKILEKSLDHDIINHSNRILVENINDLTNYQDTTKIDVNHDYDIQKRHGILDPLNATNYTNETKNVNKENPNFDIRMREKFLKKQLIKDSKKTEINLLKEKVCQLNKLVAFNSKRVKNEKSDLQQILLNLGRKRVQLRQSEIRLQKLKEQIQITSDTITKNKSDILVLNHESHEKRKQLREKIKTIDMMNDERINTTKQIKHLNQINSPGLKRRNYEKDLNSLKENEIRLKLLNIYYHKFHSNDPISSCCSQMVDLPIDSLNTENLSTGYSPFQESSLQNLKINVLPTRLESYDQLTEYQIFNLFKDKENLTQLPKKKKVPTATLR